MTKNQLIEAILGINHSAAVEFLMSFDTLDLRRYFEHLQKTLNRRGKDTVWIREPNTPAVVWQ